MLNNDSRILFLLTGWLPGGEQTLKPLSSLEWTELKIKIDKSILQGGLSGLRGLKPNQISNSLGLEIKYSERIFQLLKRGGQALFEIEKYKNQGYNIFTLYDSVYPQNLVKYNTLGSPPFFWYLGKDKLFNINYVSFIISNNCNNDSKSYVKDLISNINNDIYGISLSFKNNIHFELAELIINSGFKVMGLVPYGLQNYTKLPFIRDALNSEELILLSQSFPTSKKFYKIVGKSQLDTMLALSKDLNVIIANGGTIEKETIDTIQSHLKTNSINVNLKLPNENVRSDIKELYTKTITTNSEKYLKHTVDNSINELTGKNNNDMDNLFTIGHSNHSIEVFIELLKKHDIEKIVEVRSNPNSKYSKHFNKKYLIYELSQHDIEYLDMGRTLGGRPEDKTVLNSDNKIIEDAIEEKKWYSDSIDRLIMLSRKNNIAIMCSEENPEKCHRGYIISHTLLKRSVSVLHIRKDGTLQKGKRFPKQISFLDNLDG